MSLRPEQTLDYAVPPKTLDLLLIKSKHLEYDLVVSPRVR
jgi:hypothetical protein